MFRRREEVQIGDMEIGGGRRRGNGRTVQHRDREQIERAADIVAEAGARVIRGGRFQAEHVALQLPGYGRRGTEADARRLPTGAGCW